MKKEDLLAFIKNHLTNSIGRPKPNSIDYKDRPEYIHLVKLFPWTNSWSERIYCLENHIKEVPHCPLCNKLVNFTRNQYSKYCSRGCGSKASRNSRAHSIRASVKSKYGVENISQLDTVKAIKRDIVNSRTTEDHKRILEKRRNTNLNRYGIEEILSKVGRKTKPTKEEMDRIRNIYSDTILNDPQRKKNIDLIKNALDTNRYTTYKTLSKQLGISHARFIYLKNKENIQDIHKKTRRHSPLRDTINKAQLEQQYNKATGAEIAKEYGMSPSALNKILRSHGIPPKHIYSQSSQEREILDYIKTLIPNTVEQNQRGVVGQYEVDLYIPDYNLAIEYNGDYWHTESTPKRNNKHRIKHNLCKEFNIRLLQIRGLDWKNKETIWKSIIQNALGKTNRIYARKCITKEVPLEECNQFLDANHLQGKTRSKTRLGLYYNDELVMIQTFGVSRFKKGRTELIRMCAKLGTTVLGGATKLFKHYIKIYNPDAIDTYADLEYATGNVYKTMGFELVKITDPGYCYYDGKQYHNRMNFQKKKFNVPKHITEKEYFLGLGYRIYWDCGQACFTWTAPNKVTD